jgi:hypothetical protein
MPSLCPQNLKTGHFYTVVLSNVPSTLQIRRVKITSIRMIEKETKMKKLESELLGRVCYGFIKDEAGEVYIDEQQAKVVSMIFEKYLEGFSLGRISEWLKDSGILSPSGKEFWTRAAIDKLLSNRSYTPHIIPWEQFHQVQAEKMRRCNLEVNESGIQRKSIRYNSGYVLSGLLVCAECGANYRRITRPTGEIVWRCANRVEHGNDICKQSPSIPEACVISFLYERLSCTLADDKLIKSTVAAISISNDGTLHIKAKKAHSKSYTR